MKTQENSRNTRAGRNVSYPQRRRIASQTRSEFLRDGIVLVGRFVGTALDKRNLAPGAGQSFRKI